MRRWIVEGSFSDVSLGSFSGEFYNLPATKEDILNLESISSSRIPPDYKNYLNEINGGDVDPRGIIYRWSPGDIKKLHFFLEEDHEIIVDEYTIVKFFYSAKHENKSFDMLAALSHVNEWGGPGLLPVASTITGDFIVMDVREGDSYGSIHFMTIHGVAALEEFGLYSPLAFIAPNFTSMTRLFFDADSMPEEELQQFIRDYG